MRSFSFGRTIWLSNHSARNRCFFFSRPFAQSPRKFAQISNAPQRKYSLIIGGHTMLRRILPKIARNCQRLYGILRINLPSDETDTSCLDQKQMKKVLCSRYLLRGPFDIGALSNNVLVLPLPCACMRVWCMCCQICIGIGTHRIHRWRYSYQLANNLCAKSKEIEIDR